MKDEKDFHIEALTAKINRLWRANEFLQAEVVRRATERAAIRRELAEEVREHDITRGIQTNAQIQVLRLEEQLAEARELIATLLDYEGAEGFDKPVRDAALAFLAGEKKDA